MLDQLWPDPGDRPTRIAWLAVNWPECARIELQASPASDEDRRALAGAILAMPQELLDQLTPAHGIDARFQREGRAVRRVSAKLSAGDHDELRALLSAIDETSIFFEARQFLEALAAFYVNDPEAAELFQRIAEDEGVLSGPARHFLARLDDADPVSSLALRLDSLMQRKKWDTAARELGAAAGSLDPVQLDAFVKALLGAMAEKIDPAKAAGILKRQHAVSPYDPRLDRHIAMLVGAAHPAQLEIWESAVEWLQMHPEIFGSLHGSALSVLTAHLSETYLLESQRHSWEGATLTRPAALARALEEGERALELDGRNAHAWVVVARARRALNLDTTDHWSRFEAAHWNDVEMVAQVAEREHQRGDRDRAYALAARLRELAAEHPSLRVMELDGHFHDLAGLAERPSEISTRYLQMRELGMSEDSEAIITTLVLSRASGCIQKRDLVELDEWRDCASLMGIGPWEFAVRTSLLAAEALPAELLAALQISDPPQPDDLLNGARAASVYTSPSRRATAPIAGHVEPVVQAMVEAFDDELRSAQDYLEVLSLLPPRHACAITAPVIERFGEDVVLGMRFYQTLLRAQPHVDAFTSFRERLEEWVYLAESDDVIEELDDLAVAVDAYVDEHG